MSIFDSNIFQLTILIFILLIVGGIACLPLYGWNVRRFLASKLAIKIFMWLPIYAVVLASILCGRSGGIILAASILSGSLHEFTPHLTQARKGRYVLFYFILFVLCLGALVSTYFIVDKSVFIPFLLAIFFSSVISDVVAFFLGTYTQSAKLPNSINPNKSWYGVAGQIIGGVFGTVIASLVLNISLPWWIGLLVGAGSAVGDILNSIAKRRLNIAAWSKAIPGHGGVMDRCSSTVFAFLFVWVYLIVK